MSLTTTNRIRNALRRRTAAAHRPPSPAELRYAYLPSAIVVPTPLLCQLIAACEVSAHPEAPTALIGLREAGVLAAAGWRAAPGDPR